MTIITKKHNLCVKIHKGKNGHFEGYASVFGIVDEQNDVILKGAFVKCIQECLKTQKYPGMYYNHDISKPLGVWDQMEEDPYGLYVRGRLINTLPLAKSVEAMMHRISLGLSVGIRICKSSVKGEVRQIHEAELFEISVTQSPANEKARCFV